MTGQSDWCPTCGHAVEVFGGAEGTMHYKPVESWDIRDMSMSQISNYAAQKFHARLVTAEAIEFMTGVAAAIPSEKDS